MSLTDAQKLDAARAYCRAARGNDVAALLAMSAPDAVCWHNYDEMEVSMEKTGKGMSWIHRTVPDIAWDDIALKTTSDGFVWQSTITGTAPGGQLRSQSCLVVTLNDDGQITRIDEYLDPSQTAVLRG